ncbi:MAG: hypothetical protein L6R41_005612 [Letrouitia leprolyta]|nr:MAG: hypothetical protein L6R41_005612 [Letrouitia leprolyta]
MRWVNYLDKNFQRHLNEPGNAIFENDVASVVAFVRQQFQDTGTQKWHRASVEWLLVHLITELGVTPHADRQGQNAPTLDRAYKSILQQFKRRRDEHFNRKDRDEPASLIKDMLICKDELRRIKVLSQTREQVFESLARDIEEHEAEDIERSVEPDHPDQVTAADKIKYALARSRRETQVYERLVDDISTYLDEVYHLRSMQLRQSGIITDGQNRALVLITLVQLVFIPFATLCSYWGMNLSDINETELDQRGFWRIYGSIVVVLAIFSAFTVLSRLAWQARRFLSEEPRRKKPLMTGPVNDKLDVEGV